MKLSLAVLFLATQLAAQCRTDFVSYVSTSGAYTPATGATVLVCGLGATGTPCSPVLPIYTDQTLTTLASNPIVADAQGTFTVCAKVSTVYLQTTYRGSTRNQPTYFISSATAGIPINTLLPATGTNDIHNGNFEQDWAWSLTGATHGYGLLIFDSPASTNTDPTSALLLTATSQGSTVEPFRSTAGTNGGFDVGPGGNIESIGPNGKFIGPFQATNFPAGTPQCVVTDASNNLVPGGPLPCAGSVALNGIAAATATNSINNANFGQLWQWQLTGTNQATGLNITEPPTPSTNTGQYSALMAVLTGTGSTVMPFRATNQGNGFAVNPNGDPTVIGTAVFRGPLFGNVTGNITGTSATMSGLITGNSFNSPGLLGPGCLGTDATGNFTLTPGACTTSGGGTRLNSILGANATATIDSANFPINWNWTPGSSTGAMLKISETTAATGGSTLFAVQSLTGSSITPFCALASMNNGFCLNQTGVMQGSGTFQISLPRTTSGAGNQIQLGSSSTTGGWLNSDNNSPSGLAIGGGGMKSGGLTWQAQATTFAGVGINNSPLNNGLINFYSNSGLTVGNTFTPTSVGNLGPSGLTLSSLVSAATSCLQATAAGLIQITNFPCGGATGGASLSSLTPATAANTIQNGTFQQNWQWNFGTNTTGSAMVFSDTTQSPDTSPFMSISTLSSGMTPLDLGTNLNASQLHFGKGGVSGGWLTGSGTGQGQLSGGSSYNGSSWIGQSSSAAIISVNDSLSGNIDFYGDTGLTTGNPYTPTRMMQLSPPGNLLLNGLAGTGSRCLHTDSNGIITPTTADCGTGTGGGPIPINQLLAATNTNNINNGAFNQQWTWALTSTGSGLTLNETAGGGTGSLLQVLGNSTAVTPIDITQASAAVSAMHFGPANQGAWLSAGPNSAQISGGTQWSSSSWTARSSAASILTLNSGGAGGYSFTGNIGLTAGSTYTPRNIESFAPMPSNGGVTHQFYSTTTGSAASSFYATPGGILDMVAGAHYSGTAWTADQTSATILGTNTDGANAVILYANTGLTVGNTFTPTNVSSINTSGQLTTNRLLLNTGLNNAGGMKHQRIATCATNAAANGSCTGTLTWSVNHDGTGGAQPFADASYSVICGIAGAGNTVGVYVQSTTAGVVNYLLFNIGANAASTSGFINCMAMHD